MKYVPFIALVMLVGGWYLVAEMAVDANVAMAEFKYHRGTIDLTKTQIDSILRRPI